MTELLIEPGRENIFLNGASGLDALRAGSTILGMHRAETRKKFDQTPNSGKP